jgi:hypothetical protein
MTTLLRLANLYSIAIFYCLAIFCRSGRNQAADIDLAGDCGGDQGGAAFLEEVDGALGFGGEGVPVAL